MLSFGIAGCGDPVGTVTGTVLFEGTPVAGGSISFMPMNGIPVMAAIQADGTYKAVNIPPGETVVTIVPAPPSEDDQKAQAKILKETGGRNPNVGKAKGRLPDRYADPTKSNLRFNVQKGDNKYDPPLKK